MQRSPRLYSRLAWIPTTLLAVSLAASACRPADGDGDGAAARFDGQRAFADLRAQVEIGSRAMGSEGARRVRALISERLRQAGWAAVEDAFSVQAPDGRVLEGVNLRATRAGQRSERIWLAAHYDTKDLGGVNFVGANDGASGVAVLLELARALGTRRGPFTLELVFFDGEEAIGPNITDRDGLYGSRHLAGRVRASGELREIRAFVLLDMVGDRDLNLTPDRGSAPWLLRLFEAIARESDPGLWDASAGLVLVDDHTPFQEAGLEDAIALIDFQYGARFMPGPFWHTADDNLAAVSPESLNRVGKLVVQALEAIESRLERPRSGD